MKSKWLWSLLVVLGALGLGNAGWGATPEIVPLSTPLGVMEKAPEKVFWAPMVNRLLLVFPQGFVRLYSADVRAPGTLLATWNVPKGQEVLQFSLRGTHVLVGNEQSKVMRLYDLTTGASCTPGQDQECGALVTFPLPTQMPHCTLQPDQTSCSVFSPDRYWRAVYETLPAVPGEAPSPEKPTHVLRWEPLRKEAVPKSPRKVAIPAADEIFFSFRSYTIGAFFQRRKEVVLWDVETGKEAFRYRVPEPPSQSKSQFSLGPLFYDNMDMVVVEQFPGPGNNGNSCQMYRVPQSQLATPHWPQPVWSLLAMYEEGISKKVSFPAASLVSRQVEEEIAKNERQSQRFPFSYSQPGPCSDSGFSWEQAWRMAPDGKTALLAVPIAFFMNDIHFVDRVRWAGTAVYLWNTQNNQVSLLFSSSQFIPNGWFSSLSTSFVGSRVLIVPDGIYQVPPGVWDRETGQLLFALPAQSSAAQADARRLGVSLDAHGNVLVVKTQAVCDKKNASRCKAEVLLERWPLPYPVSPAQ